MDLRSPRRVFWILLAFPYFKPAVFAQLEWAELLENVFNVWRMAAAGVIAVLYLIDLWKTRKISPVMIGLWIYEAAIILSTVIHRHNYFYLLNTSATMVSFCMLLELSIKEDPLYPLDAIVCPLTIQITINFILLCCFSQGIVRGGGYNNAFNYLAIDNQMAAFMIPYIVAVCLRSDMMHGDLNWFCYYAVIICMTSVLLVWSATGVMVMFLMLVFVFFFYKRRWQTLFNYCTAMGAAFAFFFGIIVLRLQNVFAFLIEGVLQKGLSFTGRTVLWDLARDTFLSSPWIGKGLGLSGTVYRIQKGRYYPAHSIFYEVLVQGGICAMAGFLTMITAAGKQLMIYRKHPYACLLSAGLLAYGMVGSMESYVDNNAVALFGLFFLSYHIGTLIYGKTMPPAGSH